MGRAKGKREAVERDGWILRRFILDHGKYSRRIRKKEKNNTKTKYFRASTNNLAKAHEEFEQWFCEIFGALKQENSETDPDFHASFDTVSNRAKMLQSAYSNNLNDMLLSIPHGPLKMMDNRRGVVETSTNLAIVDAGTKRITIECSNRSASDSSLDAVEEMHKAVARLFGIKMFFQCFNDFKLFLAKMFFHPRTNKFSNSMVMT